jgi:hypothetical protein
MTDFQSFRNAVLEDDDLQEAVSSPSSIPQQPMGQVWEMALQSKTHGFTMVHPSSDEVYAHQDFLGQDGDLTGTGVN